MGRGRAKAKQTKVARELKYRSVDTDFTSLERELRGPDDGHDIPPSYRPTRSRRGTKISPSVTTTVTKTSSATCASRGNPAAAICRGNSLGAMSQNPYSAPDSEGPRSSDPQEPEDFAATSEAAPSQDASTSTGDSSDTRIAG